MTGVTMAMIAAAGRNRELGLQGDMPWKNALKKDLAFFRQQTKGHAMIMGRRTFDSFPGLLPGREHFVLTSRPLPDLPHLHGGKDLPSLLEQAKAFEAENCPENPVLFVIGGGSLYAQLLEESDELFLTEIDADFPADTWFPAFDPADWRAEQLDTQEEAGYRYTHMVYKRKAG